MTSAISQSSAATVVEDLVSDRSIPLKVCMIILNIAQLLSCWVAVGYFIKTYEIWSTLELTLSLVLLLSGSYLIPCIANAVIYGRRWKRSSVSNRRQIEEENKQAWVCLRITLSLSGLPTVGRYIETIIVSRKLSVLEKKHVKESVISHKEGSQLNPIGLSRVGSTVNQLKAGSLQRNNSVISGMSHASSTGIPESGQRKVRKARRQYKRCEHDGSLMALISGSVGAGPMAIGLGFLYFQREEIHAMASDQMTVVFTSFALNLLWLAATLTHFYPARHVLSEAEFERGIQPSHTWALVLLYLTHVIQVTLRVLCFVLFVSWFYAYVCIPIVFQWLLGTFLIVGYRAYLKTRTVGRPLSERISRGVTSFLSALFFGYVGIFDFVNANEGKSRIRYLIYYTFYYAENVAMLVIWIVRNPTTQIRYPVPFVACVLSGFWLGFILLQIYLYYYSYSRYGTTVIGLFSKKKSRKNTNYAEEIREPVFGIAVAQSAIPFWKQSHQGDQYPGSRVSSVSGSKRSEVRSVTVDRIKSPSIMSQNRTPSIFSQPGSQINNTTTTTDRVRHNPLVNPPPVLLLKIRHEQIQSQSKPDCAPEQSSSSSSDEDFQVFSPKLLPSRAHSQPDMSLSISDSLPSLSATTATPSSIIIDQQSLNGEYKAAPVHYLEHRPSNSCKSLDNNNRSRRHGTVLPIIAQPNSATKPIGAISPGCRVVTLRPLPSMKQLQHRRHPQSLPPFLYGTLRQH